MTLRPIERADLKNCAQLYANVFSASPWNEPWDNERALDRLAHFYESRGFVGFLAEETALIGFALGNVEPFHFGDMFYLREMCTQANLQSKGVGTAVYNALESALYQRGVHSIYLTTGRDIPAAGFYLARGFSHMTDMGFYAKQIA